MSSSCTSRHLIPALAEAAVVAAAVSACGRGRLRPAAGSALRRARPGFVSVRPASSLLTSSSVVVAHAQRGPRRRPREGSGWCRVPGLLLECPLHFPPGWLSSEGLGFPLVRKCPRRPYRKASKHRASQSADKEIALP